MSALLDILLICEGQGSDRFKVQRVYRIAATALAAAAATAKTPQEDTHRRGGTFAEKSI